MKVGYPFRATTLISITSSPANTDTRILAMKSVRDVRAACGKPWASLETRYVQVCESFTVCVLFVWVNVACRFH